MARETTPEVRQSVLNLWMNGLTYARAEERQGKPYEEIVAEADEATGRLNSMKEQIGQIEPRLARAILFLSRCRIKVCG